MKHLLLFIAAILCGLFAPGRGFAQQDSLFFKNKTSVACQVLSIGTDSLKCLLNPGSDSSMYATYSVGLLERARYRDGLFQEFGLQVGGTAQGDGREWASMTQSEQYEAGKADARYAFRARYLTLTSFLVFGPGSLLFLIPTIIGFFAFLVYIYGKVKYHKYRLNEKMLGSKYYKEGVHDSIKKQKAARVGLGFLLAGIGWLVFAWILNNMRW